MVPCYIIFTLTDYLVCGWTFLLWSVQPENPAFMIWDSFMKPGAGSLKLKPVYGSSQDFSKSSRNWTTTSLPLSSSASAFNSFSLISVCCRPPTLCWGVELSPPASFSPCSPSPPSSALTYLIKCSLMALPSSPSSDAPRAGMSCRWLTLSRCSRACERVCRRLAL